MSDTSEKLKAAIKLYAAYAIIAVLVVVYTLMGTIGIGPKADTSVRGVLEGMMMPYIFGICVTSLFVETGLGMGDSEDCVVRAVRAHEEAAERVAPRVEELEEWCRAATQKALQRERMRILASEGMLYSDYYDDKGRLIGAFDPKYKKVGLRGFISARAWNKQERRREKAFFRATTLKIKPLEAGELLSEGHKVGKPYDMGRSEAEYRRQKVGSSVITKPITSFILGYYGFTQIMDFDAARLLGQLYGAAVFVGFGVGAMVQALSYKKNEFTGRMNRKTGYLCQFERETDKKITNAEADNGNEKD